jgi:hypothetical protein
MPVPIFCLFKPLASLLLSPCLHSSAFGLSSASPNLLPVPMSSQPPIWPGQVTCRSHAYRSLAQVTCKSHAYRSLARSPHFPISRFTSLLPILISLLLHSVHIFQHPAFLWHVQIIYLLTCTSLPDLISYTVVKAGGSLLLPQLFPRAVS